MKVAAKSKLPLFTLSVVAWFGVKAKGATPSDTCMQQSREFHVSCPMNWFVLSSAESGIDLLSFPPAERLTGVTIKRGGAEITVELMPSGISDADLWASADRKLVDKSVPIQLPSSATIACIHSPGAFDAEIEVGPNATERDLSIYCTAKRHVYRFRLRAWKEDKRWQMYKQALLYVLKTFTGG